MLLRRGERGGFYKTYVRECGVGGGGAAAGGKVGLNHVALYSSSRLFSGFRTWGKKLQKS